MLGHAEVSQLQVSRGIQQEILWLEVTLDDFFAMQIAQSQCYLSRIEFHVFFWEASLLLEMEKQLTTLHEIHNEEHLVGCLEAPLETH